MLEEGFSLQQLLGCGIFHELSLVKLDGVKWAEHAKHFGLVDKQLPGIVIEDRAHSANYLFPASTPLSVSSLSSHFQGFLDGSLTANKKSQPAPADNSRPVKTVVGSTFNDIVLNTSKDVFVEFYAPWCGHCKALAPKWEELGEMFKDHENIVIAAIDATENDTPAKIQGFPTLLFYPANNKQSPVTYEGDRTPAAMADWVRAHSQGGDMHEDL